MNSIVQQLRPCISQIPFTPITSALSPSEFNIGLLALRSSNVPLSSHFRVIECCQLETVINDLIKGSEETPSSLGSSPHHGVELRN